VFVDLHSAGEIGLLRPLVDQTVPRHHRERSEDCGRPAGLKGRKLDLRPHAGMDGFEVVGLVVAQDVFRRHEIRASHDGVIQGLKVFAIGQVVRSGEPLMEIPPPEASASTG
jgi:hypothetical protein